MASAKTVDDITTKDIDKVMNQFNAMLSHKKPVMVKFYANWCGACKGMAEAWSALTADTALKKKDMCFLAIENDALSALNEESNKSKVPQKYQAKFASVKAFPTMMFIDADGSFAGDYNGNRDKDAMANEFTSKLNGLKKKKVAKGPAAAAPAPAAKKTMTGGRGRRRKRRTIKKRRRIRRYN
jgi:thiol-disulfide isomerase/thioredoxin